ncbi:hypothetical protein [Pseudalkalibacillus decolorationis]|uniref:hypothetical protein n=1 Tax=Pseudalkalibacillus decolorationis TaxID=163879 RepID=UPI00214774DE|nr:hypothetical protein [Pseudalkalibacillus decolorationis]
MNKKSFIQENMDSKDVFIKKLYTDLHGRIQEFEKESSRIEKMKMADAGGSLFIVGAIVIFLAAVII